MRPHWAPERVPDLVPERVPRVAGERSRALVPLAVLPLARLAVRFSAAARQEPRVVVREGPRAGLHAAREPVALSAAAGVVAERCAEPAAAQRAEFHAEFQRARCVARAVAAEAARRAELRQGPDAEPAAVVAVAEVQQVRGAARQPGAAAQAALADVERRRAAARVRAALRRGASALPVFSRAERWGRREVRLPAPIGSGCHGLRTRLVRLSARQEA